jgi:Tat protein secretion system quality control protein TatD with DNase activity
VCQQPVYSLAGIHPQCAVKQADDLESLSRKAASKAGSPVVVAALRTG